MSVLVFGKTGQVAQELQRLGGVTALGRAEAELSDPAACAAAVAASGARAVINAAAYTAVDRAEDQETLATVINGDAPEAMAGACATLGIPFVHISTDYVFDGTGTAPWRPEDTTAPLNAYGRSKLVGEEAIRAVGGPHAILRTAWVFSAHGQNFVKTMLRLGASRDHLTIVADQIGGPTPAAAIARACMDVAKQLAEDASLSGTYHFSGAPEVSWAGFARAIFKDAGLTPKVEDIPTTAFPTPAKRPANARLDCSALQDSFGIARPDWRQGLRDVLQELAARQAPRQAQ